jgi:hypothetical protein
VVRPVVPKKMLRYKKRNVKKPARAGLVKAKIDAVEKAEKIVPVTSSSM